MDAAAQRQVKWDLRFLRLAQEVSTWSKDPSTKCGAVLVDHINEIISMGYNGFPADMEDRPEWYLDREFKYKHIIHAEINALKRLPWSKWPNHPRLTLYVYPFGPCFECAGDIVEKAVVSRVVHPLPTDDAFQRWGPSWVSAAKRLHKAGIQRAVYDIDLCPDVCLQADFR